MSNSSLVFGEDKYECHEKLSEYKYLVDNAQFWLEGVILLGVGLFGMAGNVMTIVVLGRIDSNTTFNRLLMSLGKRVKIGSRRDEKAKFCDLVMILGICLLFSTHRHLVDNFRECLLQVLYNITCPSIAFSALVDSLLLFHYVVDQGIVGTFWRSKGPPEPVWYRVSFPFVFHPIKSIFLVASIFMVVAVSAERHRAICSPLTHRPTFWPYAALVLCTSGERNALKGGNFVFQCARDERPN